MCARAQIPHGLSCAKQGVVWQCARCRYQLHDMYPNSVAATVMPAGHGCSAAAKDGMLRQARNQVA